MKRSLLTLLVFFCSICVWAKVGPAVKLQFVTGNDMIVLFDEEPLLSFEKGDVVITTSKRILRYASDELLKFTYINIDKAAIENVEADYARIYFVEDGIAASNLAPRSDFAVYTQDGKLVCADQADEAGSVNAHFQVQENVVYIINTSAATFKMMKK